MVFKFRCPKCDIRLTVSEQKAGQSSRCPSCQQSIRIPPLPRSTESSDASSRGSLDSASGSIRLPGDHRPAEPPIAEAPRLGGVPLAGAQAIGSELFAPPPAKAGDAGTADLTLRVPSEDPSTLQVPRWVIYSQAGLLLLVAGSFFVLGLMAGQLGAGRGSTAAATYACQLTGTVHLRRSDSQVPDEGAVVIVVPSDRAPAQRPEVQTLRPESFEPLDNPAISAIEALGGRVVRINPAGAFDLSLAGPRDYHVLVISRGSNRPPGESIPKSELVAIGRYFFPVEELVGSHQYYWGSVKLNRQSQAIPPLVF